MRSYGRKTTQDGHEEFRDSFGPRAFQDCQEDGDEGLDVECYGGVVDEQTKTLKLLEDLVVMWDWLVFF